MNIQQQDGLVSTIVQTPFNDSQQDRDLRDQVFEAAARTTGCVPQFRLDNFDESILVFDNCDHALAFLSEVLRDAVRLHKNSNIDISFHSSLCFGKFFMHQEQIYGDAVNFATKLSLTSRENEMLVCGIDPAVVDLFLQAHSDLACYPRNEDHSCVSIGMSDLDSTYGRYAEMVLQVDYVDQTCDFDVSRCQKIEIGRARESSIAMNFEHISRHHATLKLHYDEVHLQDHSSNGTFVYFDDREVFLADDSMKIGNSGIICCGMSRDSNKGKTTMINYQIVDKSNSARSAA